MKLTTTRRPSLTLVHRARLVRRRLIEAAGVRRGRRWLVPVHSVDLRRNVDPVKTPFLLRAHSQSERRSPDVRAVEVRVDPVLAELAWHKGHAVPGPTQFLHEVGHGLLVVDDVEADVAEATGAAGVDDEGERTTG